MKKYLGIICLGLALFVTACEEKTENASSVLPRYTISEAQLDSWEEGVDFVKLTLTPESADSFSTFTKMHMNKKIDVYYGDQKLMSPDITSEAKPPDVYLMGLDESGKKKIIKVMPPEKDGADKPAQ